MAYLVLDLEMTGPDPHFHDFIQIGAILTDDKWNMIDEFETLVYPDNEDAYSFYAQRIHGLSIHDLYEAPASYEALEILEDWIIEKIAHNRRNLKHVVIAGQSIFNDISFLRAKYLRHKMDWPYAYKMLDLINIAFVFYKIFDANNIPRPKYYNLDAIANIFGIKRNSQTHNALEDARLTFLCFKEFFNLMQKTVLDFEPKNNV